MIHSIQRLVRDRLESQGLIYNPILGWVQPSETETNVSGIKQTFDGYWAISDTDRFGVYSQVKAAENYSEIRKQDVQTENNKYIDKILEDDETPF